MRFKAVLIIVLVTVVFCCNNSDDSNTSIPIIESSKPNILLIIADDMGLDATPGYAVGTTKPNMPNLQNLMDSGIRFNNLWSAPVCTPTRATIMTGKYGFNTNVLKVGDVLSTSETSIQRHLDNSNSGYSNAVIGKWHLANNDASHPTNMGVQYYAGSLGGGVPSYTSWSLTENGATSSNSDYVTSKYTDLAIDWVAQQDQPWFLWLAYNAAHTPFHLPPNDLHFQGNLPSDEASIDANPLPYYMAMLEAMDTEIGRLLNTMSTAERENTIIIFIGDNGTPGQVVQFYPSARAKGSIYQGGINVPMIISGKGVERLNATEDALINTTDLFATISQLAGNTASEINDSKSFVSLLSDANAAARDYAFGEVEKNDGTVDRAIRNNTHKYIRFGDGSEALFDLSDAILENPNLLNANQAPLSDENSIILEELRARLDEIIQ